MTKGRGIMKKLNVTNEQKMLFNLIGHNLFSMPLEIIDNVDWNVVIKESIAQSLPLVAFKNYRELPIDEETASRLHLTLKKYATSNINGYKAHEYLHNLMAKNQVQYCIIKGVASAFRYPDPLLRSMGDVDFYVPAEYIDKAKEIFLADGFTFEDTNSPHHFGLIKGRLNMELHYMPIAIPNEKLKPIFLEYWSDICDRASLVKDVFSEYVLPSDFHHGFILITHFQLHLMPRGVGLRHACDWAVFANSFSNEEFIALFEEKLKRVGLWRLAQVLSLMFVDFCGMTYKPWMGDDHVAATALAEDIANGGNFGRRDDDRGFETLFLDDNRNKGKKETRILRLFESINEIIRRRWKAVEKCPILYIFGWIYLPIKYIIKVVIGKRKATVVKSYQKGKKRTELYNSLKIFETED